MQHKHIPGLLRIKSVDESGRKITGIATTGNEDRQGDIVRPEGVKAAKTIPLFLYHDSSKTVGTASLGKATKDGIPFEASLPHVTEPGALQDRVEEAWQMLKYKLLGGVSIGFNPKKYAFMDSGAIDFQEVEVYELSLVPIPANAEAKIATVKSLMLTALGRAQDGRRSPAVAGKSTNRNGETMKTLAELLAALDTKRARLTELKALGDQATDEDMAEMDDLVTECKALDRDIRTAEVDAIIAGQAARATVVRGANPGQSRASRSPHVLVKKQDPDEKFKGQMFVKMVLAKMIAHKSVGVRPSEVAEGLWGKTHPMLVQVMKANEVPGAGTGSGEWGSELVDVNTRYTGDFLDYLYGLTVYDQIGMREMPAFTRVKGTDGAATAYFVGESKAIPPTVMSALAVDLTPLKVAALAVMSNDFRRYSTPSGEQWIRDGLIEAIVQKLDTQFLSATAASAGVSPAGILNGVSAVSASGTDSGNLRHDLSLLLAPFDTAKSNADVKLVTTRALARDIGLMVNALGQTEFPGINRRGGTLLGYDVLVSDNVPSGDIIAIAPSEIWRIGDDGVEVAVSTEAMIEQNSIPTGATDTPVAASATMTSMFQEDSTALRVIRHSSWAKRRIFAAQVITGAAYGPST